jgi:competence protein ComEC
MLSRYLSLIFSILFCVAIFLVTNIFRVPKGDVLLVSFLNVGQGDTMLIQKDDFQILIDGGPDDSVLSKISEEMPLMDRKIELIVLTHPHADHLIGINQILERYEVGEIVGTGVIFGSSEYIQFLEKIKTKKIPFNVPGIGDRREFAVNANISFLWPGNKFMGTSTKNINNTSIVSKICYWDECILSTGDLEKDGQEEMLAYYDKLGEPESLKSEIIKVPHHGSNNALLPRLYEVVLPRTVVISAGKDNQFGHPHQAVIDYFNKMLIEIWRTDQESGNIDFIISKDKIEKR